MKSRHDFPDLNVKRSDGVKPGGKPYGVLVVESKDFHRKQLVQILESERYKVIAQATNGHEALELYNEHKRDIDLITTSLDMPILDGYAFMCELEKSNPKAKVVFISEDTTKGVLQDLLKMGVADFILKPIDRMVVLNRIRQVLSKVSHDPD